MNKTSHYRRVVWRIAFFSMSAALLIGVALISVYLPPQHPDTVDIIVPDLVGTMYRPEYPDLPDVLYRITVEYRTSDTAAPGIILSQSPPAGSVRRVTQGLRPCQLRLTVSAGVPTISLPDLIGMNIDAAELKLRELGLTVIRQEQLTAQYAPGQVIRMQPQPASVLHGGDTVTLIVSTTKTARTVTVPGVVGTPKEVASAALRRAGFAKINIVYTPGDLPRDTVIEQYPLGNTIIAPAGTTVTLTVSDGSLQMPSPDANDLPNAAQQDEFLNESEGDSERMPSPNTSNSIHESE